MRIRHFILPVVICVVGMVAVASAQTRVMVRKGQGAISGSLEKFASRSYVFTNPGGDLLRAEITSRNNCVKFGSGDTSMNLALQSGDNYLDIRNDCGITLAHKISYRVE